MSGSFVLSYSFFNREALALVQKKKRGKTLRFHVLLLNELPGEIFLEELIFDEHCKSKFKRDNYSKIIEIIQSFAAAHSN